MRFLQLSSPIIPRGGGAVNGFSELLRAFHVVEHGTWNARGSVVVTPPCSSRVVCSLRYAHHVGTNQRAEAARKATQMIGLDWDELQVVVSRTASFYRVFTISRHRPMSVILRRVREKPISLKALVVEIRAAHVAGFGM